MIDLGTVRPGSTIRIPFSSFDKDDGSSITMTNYAAADILIYKDGSTTERASTAGFTATTDFDSKTGKHLAVIDLADNTTAGFFNAGSEYLVAIDAVTVDAVTTGGWIARFRIGYPDATLDTTIATLSSQTSFTLTTGPAEDSALLGCVCLIHDIASAVQHGYAVVSAYTGSTKTVTLTAGVTFTAAAGDNISFFPPGNMRWLQATLLTARDIGASVLLSSGTGTGQLDFTSGVVKANLAQILGTALTETAGLLAGGFKKFFNVASPTLTCLGVDQTGDSYARIGATGSGLTSIASQASVDAVDDFVDTEVSAIKAKTDNLPAAPASTGDVTGARDTVLSKLLKYVQLMVRKDAAIATDNATEKTAINADGGSGAGAFNQATDALEALRDQGDSAWATNTAASIRSAVGLASANLDTQLDAIPTAAENSDAVWDETLSDHLTSGTTGAGLNAAGAAGDPWSTALPGSYGAGTAGKIVGDNLTGNAYTRLGAPAGASIAADIATRLASSAYTAPLSAAGTRSALGMASANLDTQLDALPTAAENADAVWDEATADHTTAGTTGKAISDAGAGGTPLDAAGVRAAIGMASANLDTQIANLPTDADVQTQAKAALAAYGAIL